MRYLIARKGNVIKTTIEFYGDDNKAYESARYMVDEGDCDSVDLVDVVGTMSNYTMVKRVESGILNRVKRDDA